MLTYPPISISTLLKMAKAEGLIWVRDRSFVWWGPTQQGEGKKSSFLFLNRVSGHDRF
jgi:hypothetical protein